MIYIWTIPTNYKNKAIGEYDRKVSPESHLLMQGRILLSEEFKEPAEVNFEISKDAILKFDCLPNNAPAPLVNERIKNVLELHAPNDVQFVKAKLNCKDGVLDGYYYLNLTQTIVGIDHEKSFCIKLKVGDLEFINGFNYLFYLKDCMGKHKLARDKEFKPHLLVDESIKNIFDKEKITGVRFARPEEYYKGPLTPDDLIAEHSND
jgi:hypothetical protein